MRALPQPQYLAYTMEGEGDNLSIGLRVIRHLVWLEMMTGSASFPSEWAIRHRTDDYASEITMYEGQRLVSTRAFFDPTWYGAFRALRDGMLMYQQTDLPVSAYATPTPGPSPDLRTIAVVTVMGSAVYRVEDRGVAACTNGDAGHALHLVSREPDPRHQLADVVVDVAEHAFLYDAVQRSRIRIQRVGRATLWERRRILAADRRRHRNRRTHVGHHGRPRRMALPANADHFSQIHSRGDISSPAVPIAVDR